MNIFVLDTDPQKAAQYHCDKHVVKMILETAQLLSNCVPEGQKSKVYYKRTHILHPCSVWVQESKDHFQWLYELGEYLCEEYQIRFGKIHKSKMVINNCKEMVASQPSIVDPQPFVFCQVMPEKYKIAGDPVSAYRNYYIAEKAKIAKWRTKAPFWWPKSL